MRLVLGVIARDFYVSENTFQNQDSIRSRPYLSDELSSTHGVTLFSSESTRQARLHAIVTSHVNSRRTTKSVGAYVALPRPGGDKGAPWLNGAVVVPCLILTTRPAPAQPERPAKHRAVRRLTSVRRTSARQPPWR